MTACIRVDRGLNLLLLGDTRLYRFVEGAAVWGRSASSGDGDGDGEDFGGATTLVDRQAWRDGSKFHGDALAQPTWCGKLAWRKRWWP